MQAISRSSATHNLVLTITISAQPRLTGGSIHTRGVVVHFERVEHFLFDFIRVSNQDERVEGWPKLHRRQLQPRDSDSMAVGSNAATNLRQGAVHDRLVLGAHPGDPHGQAIWSTDTLLILLLDLQQLLHTLQTKANETGAM